MYHERNEGVRWMVPNKDMFFQDLYWDSPFVITPTHVSESYGLLLHQGTTNPFENDLGSRRGILFLQGTLRRWASLRRT